jgi:anthranilate synthase/aminodeoxychorismate synthase-like glutamine amidotransferase
MILLIDNYDSFVYNLARYVRELGEDALVRRHDAVGVEEIAEEIRPSHIVISPGPCTPAEAGVSTDVVRALGARIPILGVCLGHQCIGAAYGADVLRAGRPMHGKTSLVTHDGTSVFTGLPSPLEATRYHSLVVARETLPPSLRVTAVAADDGEIMGLEHREHPVVGVQFHPESASTEHGYAMLDRFLHGARARVGALPDRADGARSAPAARREAGAAGAHPPVELVR